VIEYFDQTIVFLRERKNFGNAKVYYHTKNALSSFNKENNISASIRKPWHLCLDHQGDDGAHQGGNDGDLPGRV